MELSKRMNAVAQMAPAGHITADVGCDHGFVSIYLVKRGVCPHVYAVDVRPGPLARAKAHIAESGLSGYITPVLSDGLKEVPVGNMAAPCGREMPETDRAAACARLAAGKSAHTAGADVMIAAGMGGRLTIRILSDVPEKTGQLSYVVLEPQSEVWLVRRWLRENDFVIIDEDMVLEDGKYYPVIKAKNCRTSGNEAADESPESVGEAKGAKKRLAALERQLLEAGVSKEMRQTACDRYGPFLMIKKSAVLLSFLEHTIENDSALLRRIFISGIDSGKAERIGKRKKELEERIELAKRIAGLLKSRTSQEREV